MNVLEPASGRAPRPRAAGVAVALLSLLCLLPALSPAALAREVGGTTGERLDRFVREQLQRTGAPGVAYAVVSPHGVEHQGVRGVDGDGEPITPETAFLWGSVAKPATATLLMLLAADGELDLDATVTTYLPDFRTAGGLGDRITVRQLVRHTSGLPEGLGMTDRFESGRRPSDVLPVLAGQELLHEPGAGFDYSSVNYLVLAAVVEAATGRAFAEVLTDRVLDPAGMATAITTPAESEDRLPPGHRYVLGRAVPFTTDYDPAGAGYGYLGGSLDDAVAFARAHLAGSELLSGEQLTRLHAPGVDAGEGRSYGLGWRTWPVHGADAPMVWHSGAVAGYFASVVLLPGLDRAVVVLQNVYGSFQEDALLDTAWGMASLLSGAEPELHEPGAAYPVILAALGGVCLLLMGLAVHWVRRAVRPRRGARTGVGPRAAALVAWLVGLGLVGVALAALPAAYGVGVGQVVLWAPDVAYLLMAGFVLVGVDALLRVAVAVRSVR